MRIKQALCEFITSHKEANLNPVTTRWYEGQLAPFARSCPNLPCQSEPIKDYLTSVRGSPETGWCCYRALKTFFRFISQRHGIHISIEDIEAPRRPRKEGLL